jgi:hypothetical protein
MAPAFRPRLPLASSLPVCCSSLEVTQSPKLCVLPEI